MPVFLLNIKLKRNFRNINKYLKLTSSYFSEFIWVNQINNIKNEQLDALYRAYRRNFSRRIKVLENILAPQETNENIHRGIVRFWKQLKLKKLKEEYDMLIEIKTEIPEFKYID